MSGRISGTLVFMMFWFVAESQVCNDTVAAGCYCSDTLQINCDLLPDITIAVKATTDSGRYVEYPPFNAGENSPFQGSDDGRFRLGIATPNIGAGPLHVTMTSLYVCGTDTFTTYPGTCPNGKEPMQLIRQRIYHKNDTTMSFYERLAGFTSFHFVHNHVHVEDWCSYSLRIKNPAEPDPLKWPILGEQNKIGFCLYNFGTCSGDTGYCRDKKDSVLFNEDFKNFTLGSYPWCSPTEQGISPGHYDYYYKELFGMWIDIPPGTCNGIYQLVINADPYNRYKESDESNNVAVIPVTLSKQQNPGNAKAKVLPQGNTVICQGDSVELRATAGTVYSWSTGDTVPVIYIKTAGKYAVKVVSYCGTAVSDTISVRVISNPAVPQVTSDTVCKFDAAFLKSAGATDCFYWYNQAVGGTPLDTGTVFQTHALSQTTAFYVEAVDSTAGMDYAGGKTDSAGRGRYLAGGKYLVFDCLSPFTLKAVTVYSKNNGFGTVEIRDQYGTAMQSKLIGFAAGKNRIVLDMDMLPEKSVQLFFSGTDDTLFVNDSLVDYPYDVPGLMSVKNSSLSKKEYVFFYNWEIQAADLYCRSARVQVLARVDSSCVSAIGELKKISQNIIPWQDDEKIYFKWNGIPGKGSCELFFYDISGRNVWNAVLDVTTLAVPKYIFKNGLYLYTIRSKQSQAEAKGKIVVFRE